MLDTKIPKYRVFTSYNIYLWKCKKADEKKSEQDELTLEDLSSAYHRLQTKCQLIQTSYIKQTTLLLLAI